VSEAERPYEWREGRDEIREGREKGRVRGVRRGGKGRRERGKGLGALQSHQLPHPLAKILDPPLPTAQVFTGQMPFLLPSQQRQSTESINQSIIKHSERPACVVQPLQRTTSVKAVNVNSRRTTIGAVTSC